MTKSCTCTTRRSKIKVEENKRKAVFRNPKRLKYLVSTIDGCLITSGMRADYLVTQDTDMSVLVELKGTDVKHACDQLFTSAENEDVKPLMAGRVGFLVICSKYPRFDSFVAKAKQKAVDKYKGGFHVVTGKGEFEISRIVDIEDT